jgi:hypothetical protein
MLGGGRISRMIYVAGDIYCGMDLFIPATGAKAHIGRCFLVSADLVVLGLKCLTIKVPRDLRYSLWFISLAI